VLHGLARPRRFGACRADGEAVDPGSSQRPPRGAEALAAWLEQKHHLAWRCEEKVSQPRLTGNHGRHRICSNEIVRETGAGPFPVGAASVKELWGAGAMPVGFAVGLKVEAGEGTNTWYWYERRADALLADGTGLPQCAVCHVQAPRDYVFIRAE
jgi:hypothetical protein